MSESHDHDEHTHDSVPLEQVNFAAETPVHVFIVKSNMSSRGAIEKMMPDSLKTVYDKASQEMRDKIDGMIANLAKDRGTVRNYISLMITRDSAGIFRAYSTQANEKQTGENVERKRAPGEKGLCRELSSEDECMDENMIRMNTSAHETMFEVRQSVGDWNGEVELMKAYDGENCLQEARNAIGADMFDTLYPAAPAVASPIQAEDVEKAKPLSATKRAALVEKFGETAIRDLEEKVHGKSKGV